MEYSFYFVVRKIVLRGAGHSHRFDISQCAVCVVEVCMITRYIEISIRTFKHSAESRHSKMFIGCVLEFVFLGRV